MGKYIDGINEERFDAFLSDLRSGNYKQGMSALHTVDKYDDDRVEERFCCLGVACIRPAAEGVIEVRHPDSNGYMVKYDGHNGTDLPAKVADYLGIPLENREGGDVAFFKLGYKVHEDGTSNGFTAIGLNDRFGKSFDEIADAFEKEFTRE
jgi:hypothetical protein